MKSHRLIATLAIAAIGCAGLSTASAQANATRPTVITPPAVKDGSNFSRAPFPAQRQFDDVKSPDGIAIDNTVPPNSPASNIEPPLPVARVAVGQGAQTAPVAVVTTTPVAVVAVAPADPVLTPTGRTSIATSLDAATFGPSIRSASHAQRDQIIADIESRFNATEASLNTMRGTASQMSANGRQSFDTAANELKDQAKSLKKSINNARKASATEWDNARSQLAADFDAYASSITRIDGIAR